MKQKITITIDRELYQQCRDLDINISGHINELLKQSVYLLNHKELMKKYQKRLIK